MLNFAGTKKQLMKFGVVTFPGSNCDQDMIYVLRDKMGLEVRNIWHKESSIGDVDFVILPGGFSYGDYLRSGAIANYSPIMDEVIKHAKRGGYVLGICNGFQILCESKLLPGTLLHNLSHNFICRNAYIKSPNNASIINQSIDPNKVLKIPVAHGEGRFFAPNEIMQSVVGNNQVIFKYCDENGNYTEESNLNGSIDNIAGICNENRNVFGMMPHPERAADEELGNTDGRLIFESLLGRVETLV